MSYTAVFSFTIFFYCPHFFFAGEHIDYSGYAVLPMAIDNDTVVAVKVHKDTADRRIGKLKKKKVQKAILE